MLCTPQNEAKFWEFFKLHHLLSPCPQPWKNPALIMAQQETKDGTLFVTTWNSKLNKGFCHSGEYADNFLAAIYHNSVTRNKPRGSVKLFLWELLANPVSWGGDSLATWARWCSWWVDQIVVQMRFYVGDSWKVSLLRIFFALHSSRTVETLFTSLRFCNAVFSNLHSWPN